jgi:hypothetical protein
MEEEQLVEMIFQIITEDFTLLGKVMVQQVEV